MIDKRTFRSKGIVLEPAIHSTSLAAFEEVGGRLFLVFGFRLYEVVVRSQEDVEFRLVDLGANYVRRIEAIGDTALVVERLRTNTSLSYGTLGLSSMRLDSISTVDFMTRDFTVADDGLWLTTVQGLYFIRFSDRRLFSYSTSNSQIHENRLANILKLRHQPILYVGSTDGVIKLNYYVSKFNLTDMRRYSTSKSNDVRRVFKDSHGGYWVWCVDGLFHRDANSVMLESVENKSFSFKNEFGRQMIESPEKDGVYVLTTFNVLKMSYDAREVRKVFPNEKRQRFCSMHFIDRENVVLTTSEGYIVYNVRTHRKHEVDLSAKIGVIMVSQLSDNWKLWVGTAACKIYEVDIESGRVGKPFELGHDVGRINCMRYLSENGMRELWIGTSKQGLYYYAPDFKAVRRVAYSNYISYQANCMELDANGGLWIGTDKGILNITDGQATEFSNRDFSICSKINVDASCLSPTGEILMGGINSFVEFDTEKFSKNGYFPPPQVASYYLANAVNPYFDGFTGEEHLLGSDTIIIPAGIRSLRLFVRELNYDRPNENKIQWQLDDDGDQWHDETTIAGMTLTNISGGVHQLRLRSVDSDNKAQEPISTVWLDKEIFFYETMLFRVALVGLALFLLAFFFYRRDQLIKKRRRMLESEVARQTGIIRKNNDELRHSQAIIREQYLTIKRHKEELEEAVAVRTAELNAAKLKAEETSQLKSNFLASLSHEVRTPMNAIVGFAKLLADEQCPDEERVEFARMILESSGSMLSLIGDLLDTSRIERGILPIAVEPFDVHRAISDVFSMLSVEKRNPNVEFKLVIDDSLKGRTMESDKQRIRQLVINLVYNAFKFTAKGHVAVIARYLDAGVDFPQCHYPEGFPRPPKCPLLLLSVQDTGIGIPKDKQVEIFEPFRRLTTNNIRYSGLGLGLNIVRNIAILLGGRVWVHSQQDVGSEFFVYLPFDKSLVQQQQARK